MAAIDSAEFRARWLRWYRDGSPIPWELGMAAEDRWMRVHSLPAGKRLPDTDAERSVILARHNAVADAIIDGAPCVLLGYDLDGGPTLPAADPLRAWLPGGPLLRVPAVHHPDHIISVFAARVPWRPGLLDDALLAVADDHVRLVLLNWDTGAAYAPYDGGADLYWASGAERDAARMRFTDWLAENDYDVGQDDGDDESWRRAPAS